MSRDVFNHVISCEEQTMRFGSVSPENLYLNVRLIHLNKITHFRVFAWRAVLSISANCCYYVVVLFVALVFSVRQNGVVFLLFCVLFALFMISHVTESWWVIVAAADCTRTLWFGFIVSHRRQWSLHDIICTSVTILHSTFKLHLVL